MGALASLSLNLGVNTADWSKGIKTAGDSMGKFAESVASKTGNIAKSMAGLGKSAAVGLGGIGKAAAGVAGGLAIFETAKAGLSAGLDATVGAVAGGIERIDQLADTAQSLGVTTEALSSLRYAADLTGSSAVDLDGALEKLNANLGDAAQKGTPAGEALARLGLDAKALAGIPADQAFRKIVAGFEKVPNAADKASIAMDIFGKGGLKILNTLGAGSGEIDRLADEAGRLGVAVGQVDAARIGMAKDAMDRMGMAVQGVGNQLAIVLAPAIETASGAMTEFLGKTVDQAGGAAGAIGSIARVVGVVADAVVNTEWLIQKVWAKMAADAGKVLSLIGVDAGKMVQDFAKVWDEDIKRNFAVMPSEKIGKFLDDAKKKSDEAAKAAADAAKANQGMASGMDGIGKSVKELTDKLKEQAATFGMTAAEADIYKLATKGATAEQLAGAKAVAGQLKELEKAKKDRDDLEGRAKDIVKAVRTPEERVAHEAGEIDKARRAGFLNDDQAKKAKEQSRKAAGLDEVKFAGAVDARSSGGYSAIVNALSGRGSGMNELVTVNRDQNKNLVTIVGLLRKDTRKAPEKMEVFSI